MVVESIRLVKRPNTEDRQSVTSHFLFLSSVRPPVISKLSGQANRCKQADKKLLVHKKLTYHRLLEGIVRLNTPFLDKISCLINGFTLSFEFLAAETCLFWFANKAYPISKHKTSKTKTVYTNNFYTNYINNTRRTAKSGP